MYNKQVRNKGRVKVIRVKTHVKNIKLKQVITQKTSE